MGSFFFFSGSEDCWYLFLQFLSILKAVFLGGKIRDFNESVGSRRNELTVVKVEKERSSQRRLRYIPF